MEFALAKSLRVSAFQFFDRVHSGRRLPRAPGPQDIRLSPMWWWPWSRENRSAFCYPQAVVTSQMKLAREPWRQDKVTWAFGEFSAGEEESKNQNRSRMRVDRVVAHQHDIHISTILIDPLLFSFQN